MITAAPFVPQHLLDMAIQPAQSANLHLLRAEHLEFFAAEGAWSGMVDGKAVVCGGIIVNPLGIGHLYAFLSPAAGPYMVAITRFGRRLLELQTARRIEASARVDFGAGCRWLKMLGFSLEGTMRKFDPDGSDHFLYARTTP
jgi:hypothetical protein